MKGKEFIPKLFTLIRSGISRQQLAKDVMAGVIVGIVALPLAIAFAIASGVSPERGLVTAVICGMVISVLGGSRVQIGGRHRSNMELVAQGTANVFSGLFGGIPATGAIARTATNIRNGGRTPVAGIVHALVLLLIMLLFAPVAKLIPLSCLAGILVVVAWHMGEWKQFFSLLKSNRMDLLVLLVTFFLTVFFDLIIAIEVGLILSSFIFMKRMSEATAIRMAVPVEEQTLVAQDLLFEEELADLPKGITMYEISGPLFFGASKKFQDVITNLNERPKVLILRMRHVPFIDATGLNALKSITTYMCARGAAVLISGANEEVRSELHISGVEDLLGAGHIHRDITLAVAHARELLEGS